MEDRDGGPRVLVVEADPRDPSSLAELIRGRGYTVVGCENEERAWELFQAEPTGIVVLDPTLPGSDGEALCRRIRGHRAGVTAVILAALGWSEKDTLPLLLEAGVDDFVPLPAEPRQMEVRLALAECRLRERQGGDVSGTPLREVFASIDVAAGRLVKASHHTRSLFGIENERLVNDPHLWRDFFKVGVAWEDLVESPSGAALAFEYPITTPAGEARWIRSSVSMVPDPATGDLLADGVFVDATKEREAHLGATARNEELTALHRLSELILAAASLEEAYERIVHHVGDVLECPVVAIELLDPERDRLDLVACRGIEFLENEDRSVPLHHTLSGLAVRTGEPLIDGDPQSRNEHQAPFLVRLRLRGYAAFPMAAGDEVRGTLMLATLKPREFDESFRRLGASLATTLAVYLDRLEAEAALRNSEARYRMLAGQLQQANDELQSFAYSVSHDLRAPLRTMQGFAHALLRDFGDELAPRARDFADRIIAAGRQSEALINDLLTYSRLSFERVELKIVDLNSVVSAVLEQAQADLQQSGAEVEVSGTLPKVLGSHTTLVQVLANLVGNAVKFVPDDRVPRVRIRSEDLGDRTRIFVEDNGIGIPEGQEERIFRVFERLSEVDGQPGTGIGLAIVRRGMQRIRGACGVQPSPEGGSAFWIEILKERRTAWRGHGRRV